VLFFSDTFETYYGGTAGIALVRLLRQIDCPVLWALPDGFPYDPNAWGESYWPSGLRCCGRPMISNGLLSQAVQPARHNVERLYPWVVDTDRPIVACEPSCILTIKDDYPALLKGNLRRKAEAVAAACQTFEDFLDSQLASKADLRARFRLDPGPKKILV